MYHSISDCGNIMSLSYFINVGWIGALPVAIVSGTMFGLLTYLCMFYDSNDPGSFPPSPVTPRRRAGQSRYSYHHYCCSPPPSLSDHLLLYPQRWLSATEWFLSMLLLSLSSCYYYSDYVSIYLSTNAITRHAIIQHTIIQTGSAGVIIIVTIFNIH